MAWMRLRGRWRWAGLMGALVLGAGVLLGSTLRRGEPRVDPLAPGLAAYGVHDWPVAEKVARERLRTHRDDPEAMRLLARSLFRQGQDRPAATIQARVPGPLLTAEDLFLRGQAAVRLGEREYGILLWRRALGKNPDHVETLMALEQTLTRLDLLSEAARAAERLAALPGWEARGALMIGRIRAEQSDPAGAAEALRRALERRDQWHGADRPDRVGKQLARALLRTGRPGQARAVLQRFTDPAGDAEAGWLLSRCDLQQGMATRGDISASARSYRDEHPLEPEPAPFLGEGRCRECHRAIFQAQHRSRHARTFFRKEQVPSLTLPDRPVPDPDNRAVAHEFACDGDRVAVRTRVGDDVFQTVVDYAMGSGDRGLTLVGHDREGRPYEFRLSRYSGSVGWDVTSGQPRGTGRPELYQGMRINADAVRRCLTCHTTHAHAITTGSGPESADAAIGCERCHGPGGHHLKALEARADDLAIARPTLADAPGIVALCAQCHSPRDPELPVSPDQIESVRFQGTTFTWSRCYADGRSSLHCVTCHDPHRDAETAPAWYEARCLDCHRTPRSDDRVARQPGQSRPVRGSPCPVQPERGCIECHMPRVTIPMAHADFTDHYIRVHPEKK